MTDVVFATLASAFVQIVGLISSSRLVSYRLSQLEQRVDKHNNIVERLYRVEDRAKSNSHRIDSLENDLERSDTP